MPRRVMDVALLALSVVVVWKASALALRVDVRELDDARRASITVSRSPLIERPFDLYCPTGSDAVLRSETLAEGDTLVVVVGERSEKSESTMRVLHALFAGVAWRPGQRIVVVSDGRNPSWRPPADLGSGKAPVTWLRMRDRASFVYSTGISEAPSVLLFRNGRLVLMASGPLEVSDEGRWKQALGDRSTGSSGNPFSSEQLGDPLVETGSGDVAR
jgi:hypothetical protein